MGFDVDADFIRFWAFHQNPLPGYDGFFFFLAFFFLTEAKSLIAAQLVQSFPAFAQGVVSHRFVLQFFFSSGFCTLI